MKRQALLLALLGFICILLARSSLAGITDAQAGYSQAKYDQCIDGFDDFSPDQCLAFAMGDACFDPLIEECDVPCDDSEWVDCTGKMHPKGDLVPANTKAE